MSKQIKIGVEQVLYAAATDEGFCAALLADREAALEARGLKLGPTERAMLRDVSDEQLLANVAGMDVSPQNQQRRSFMRLVTAGAMTVAAADALAACGGGDDTGIRPDMPDQTVPDAESPDSGAPDAAGPDTTKAPDKGWLDVKTSWGSRPNKG